MQKALALAALLLLAACGADSTAITSDAPPAFAYPPAARVAQVDDYHGTRVADPYRWLERRRRRADARSGSAPRTRSRSRISKGFRRARRSRSG